ncbi:hypothetical protein Tco_1196019, partial [Tanacetum coccineum]
MHITFLENKPNVAGKGPTWLFDLDYLTDSMNYHPVSSENQANLHACQQEANQNAGTEEIINSGVSEKENESAQDYFVLPIWPSYSSPITPALTTDDKREGPREEEQVFIDELERLKKQEKEANEEAEALRKKFETLVIQEGAAKPSSTNIFSTVSTPAKASSTNPVNTVSIPQRFPSKSFSKKHKVHKESVSKQGRKFAKGKSSVQRDPLFDEIPEDTVDHMDIENAQDEGRTREIVDEDKEIEENVLSTEDVLSTDKEVVSTDKEEVSTDNEKVSTDRPIVSTDGSKVSTDMQIEGTDEQVKGTEEHNEGTEDKNEGTEEIFEGTEELRKGTEELRKGTEEKVESTDGQVKGSKDQTEEEIATQTSTLTPTSMIFGDDETIA